MFFFYQNVKMFKNQKKTRLSVKETGSLTKHSHQGYLKRAMQTKRETS
jgi:hypothetical protein